MGAQETGTVAKKYAENQVYKDKIKGPGTQEGLLWHHFFRFPGP